MNRRDIILGTILGALLWLGIIRAFAAPITLTWDAPLTNTDGTACTDLAGYKLAKGSVSRVYSVTQDVGNVTTGRFADVGSSFVDWPASSVTQSLDSASWRVIWPLVVCRPGPTNYFAALAYNVDGVCSDWSEELAYAVPALRTTNYVVRWGITATGLGNTVNLGTNPVWTANRSDYNRTVIYAAAVAFMSDGNVLTNSVPISINNKKFSPPKRLDVVQ